jgi:hypothetical protein
MIQNLIVESKISSEKILGMGVGISGYFTDENEHINTHTMLNNWAEVNNTTTII